MEAPNLTEAIADKIGADHIMASLMVSAGLVKDLFEVLLLKGILTKQEAKELVDRRRQRAHESLKDGVREKPNGSDGDSDLSPEYREYLLEIYRSTIDARCDALIELLDEIPDADNA